VDVVAGSGAAAFFTDGFESGDLSNVQGGFDWQTADPDVTVQAGRGTNASYGLQFRFVGVPAGSDSGAECRFDMGALYSEVTIEFDLYVPDGTEAWGGAAYFHRTDSPNNNKFFRLWGSTYSDREKVGASLWRTASGGSNTNAEWSVGGGIGENGTSGQRAELIGSADLGAWMAVKFYVKAPTASTGGIVQIWKNGALLIERANLANYTEGELHAYRYGYLFGAANSGFDSTTYLIIDNVKFYSGVA
jgi:hypothetical protein